MIYSYAKAVAEFERARSKEAGRRINRHLRLFACPEGIRMDYDKLPLCVFTPDNKLTFVISNDSLSNIAHSLCQMLHNATPLALDRKRQGVYQIWAPSRLNWNYTDKCVAVKYIYHKGLQFDLDTRACLNPVSDPKDIVIPEARKVWLDHLREFKKQVLVRQKLGVLDSVMREGLGIYNPPLWDAAITDILYDAMRSKTVTTDQLEQLAHYVRTHYFWFNNNPDSKMVADRIVSLCTQKFNFKLRAKFGVFGGV